MDKDTVYKAIADLCEVEGLSPWGFMMAENLICTFIEIPEERNIVMHELPNGGEEYQTAAKLVNISRIIAGIWAEAGGTSQEFSQVKVAIFDRMGGSKS